MITLKIKIKPEAYPWLEQCAKEANEVWNYCRRTYALGVERRKFFTPFDLINMTSGSSQYFKRIGAESIANVAKEYGIKIKVAQKKKLKYRGIRNPWLRLEVL